MRPDKDTYFLRHALIASQMSTCVRRSVGCVLVNSRSQILGVGFNGVPSGLPHCNEGHPCPGAAAASGTQLSDCYATHAEVNALIQCRDPYAIETVYTTTSPCVDCTKVLLNTSAKRIVFLKEYPQPVAKSFWEMAGRLWVQSGGTNGWWTTDCERCGGLGMVPISGGMGGWQTCGCPNLSHPRASPAPADVPTTVTNVVIPPKKIPDPLCKKCGGSGEVSVGGGCMGYDDEACSCLS